MYRSLRGLITTAYAVERQYNMNIDIDAVLRFIEAETRHYAPKVGNIYEDGILTGLSLVRTFLSVYAELEGKRIAKAFGEE